MSFDLADYVFFGLVISVLYLLVDTLFKAIDDVDDNDYTGAV